MSHSAITTVDAVRILVAGATGYAVMWDDITPVTLDAAQSAAV